MRRAVDSAFLPRVLLAFDFDGTLASDTTDAILDVYGIGREEWAREFEEPLGTGWDEINRRGEALIALGRRPGSRCRWTCCARPPTGSGHLVLLMRVHRTTAAMRPRKAGRRHRPAPGA